MSKRKEAIPLSALMGGSKTKMAKTEQAKAEPTAGDNQNLEAELEAINAIGAEFNQLDDAQAEEVLQVAKKYAKLKVPIYERRETLIQKVPEFWLRVLLAHPHIGENVSELDQGPLSYLISLQVVEIEGTQQDFRINFHFSENPFFSNKTLWKEYQFNEEAAVVSSDVNWKDTELSKDLQATLVGNLLAMDPVPDVQPSFFSIFHKDDRDFQIGDIIKNEVWPDPLSIYMSCEFEEEMEEVEIDDDDEEDDGDDGEEGDEQEGDDQ